MRRSQIQSRIDQLCEIERRSRDSNGTISHEIGEAISDAFVLIMGGEEKDVEKLVAQKTRRARNGRLRPSPFPLNHSGELS